MPKANTRAEFGDFQTPHILAKEACRLIRERIGQPRAVLEPTCGQGTFVSAALDVFSDAEAIYGYDVNARHLADAAKLIENHQRAKNVTLLEADFFNTDWSTVLRTLPAPVLILGNPPWVTNAELGTLGSANLPQKSNLHGLVGLDALTGKSNFDISEWMLLRLLESLRDLDAALAMLVKTAVARKVLNYLWSRSYSVHSAAMYAIDAKRHFDAAVDACLFIIRTGDLDTPVSCEMYAGLRAEAPDAFLGFDDGRLLADAVAFRRRRHLLAESPVGWRSGVKHDCAKVFELQLLDSSTFRNGFGERIELEDDLVFPLLKSSHVANDRLDSGRYVILPQRRIGEDTSALASVAPKTWAYLTAHGDLLDARKSSIYRKRPRFSIFGIGDYSFSLWKVAISGLYKNFRFTVVPPRDGKPMMLDDTVYFLACASEHEAHAYATLLNGEEATDFFSAFLFRDAKRPITTKLLNQLDLRKLAIECGVTTAESATSAPPKQLSLDARF